ncbi:MAG: hypothetical protein R3C44_19290 [Chloroflexota bacterium]
MMVTPDLIAIVEYPFEEDESVKQPSELTKLMQLNPNPHERPTEAWRKGLIYNPLSCWKWCSGGL